MSMSVIFGQDLVTSLATGLSGPAVVFSSLLLSFNLTSIVDIIWEDARESVPSIIDVKSLFSREFGDFGVFDL